jgi:hypothetical protein
VLGLGYVMHSIIDVFIYHQHHSSLVLMQLLMTTFSLLQRARHLAVWVLHLIKFLPDTVLHLFNGSTE